jgi:hypothetical protein
MIRLGRPGYLGGARILSRRASTWGSSLLMKHGHAREHCADETAIKMAFYGTFDSKKRPEYKTKIAQQNDTCTLGQLPDGHQ